SPAWRAAARHLPPGSRAGARARSRWPRARPASCHGSSGSGSGAAAGPSASLTAAFRGGLRSGALRVEDERGARLVASFGAAGIEAQDAGAGAAFEQSDAVPASEVAVEVDAADAAGLRLPRSVPANEIATAPAPRSSAPRTRALM